MSSLASSSLPLSASLPSDSHPTPPAATRTRHRFSTDEEDAVPSRAPVRYSSPSLPSGPSHRRPSGRKRPSKHHASHGHVFPERADSLRNVATLAKLVDYRSNWYEAHRLSSDAIRERTRPLGWRRAAAVTAFYERQNEILDGWREVDEILDSRFPEEVMRRFAMHEDEGRRRQESLDRRASRIRDGRVSDGAASSGGEVEGRASDDDDDDDEDDDGVLRFGRGESRPLKRSFSAKAVSALSGLWFSSSGGDGGSRPATPGRGPPCGDLESATASRRPKYGRGRHARGERRGVAEQDLAEEDGYNEDEEEEDDDDGRAGEASRLLQDRRRGRRSARRPRGGPYGTMHANPSATELYDRIREEGRHQEMKRSASSITLPASLQKATNFEPRSDSPTIDGAATPPVVRQIENIPEHGPLTSKGDGNNNGNGNGNGYGVAGTDNDSELALGSATAAPAHQRISTAAGSVKVLEREGEGSLDRKFAEERRQRPFATHSAERQALLDTVPNRDRKEENARGVQFAININLLVNVLLLGGKGIAVVSSNSVSLIASLVDSALDLLSTVIIFATSKAIAYRSWRTFYKYPVGKKRLEPLGVVIFSVLMIASFCQVLIESAQRLRLVVSTGGTERGPAASLPLMGVAFMMATIAIKAVMWLLYRSSKSSGVRAVAQDAENDVIFNVVSLTFPLIGARLGFPTLDPLGGIVLSLYIIYEWLQTLFETLQKLSGATASAEQVSKCLYLVTRFNSVSAVSAFELFHAGDEYIAEADVVLPQSFALKEAHDLGEIITYCMESLEGVERAYLHPDYNAAGPRGHIGLRG